MTTGRSSAPQPAQDTRLPYSKPRLSRYGSVGAATDGPGDGSAVFSLFSA